VSEKDRAAINEAAVASLFETGLRFHKEGSLNEAKIAYHEILTLDPDHADSIHLLGLIAHQNGHPDVAFVYIKRAVDLAPHAAHFHSNLGNVLRDLGRFAEAAKHHRIAADLRPHSAEIRSNLATVLVDLDRLLEALAAYEDAMRLAPDVSAYRYNHANVLTKLGRYKEAEAAYRHILAEEPALAEAHYGLGNALTGLHDMMAAVACYRQAITLRPDFAEAHSNLGITLQMLEDLEEATLAFRASLAVDPKRAETHYNLGCALLAQNRTEDAIASYQQALALAPHYAAARFALCAAQLPMLYMTQDQIHARRAAYSSELQALTSDPGVWKRTGTYATDIGTSQPFFLAYQGQNDTELQKQHGSFVCKIMQAAHGSVKLPAMPRAGEKIRLGIVSGFFHRHTVWSLMLKGWLSQIDRERFSVFSYHTGTKHDAITDSAASMSDRFIEMQGAPDNWRKAILADAPHVLLYPEIGMDPLAGHLAAQRLARVQCMSWGHPITSGMPSIDYFLSSDAMEPDDAATHYSEHLVRLPNLGIYYEQGPRPLSSIPRAELGLRQSATVYWSGQALYKYLPQYDDVFPHIARAVGDCQFVFIAFARSKHVTDCFRDRLFKRFAAQGLDPDYHCVILPSMSHERFIAAAGQADAVLDTIGWSGGKSTLDILDQNLPIVTMRGPFMRSLHSAAMLDLMGIGDTITDTLDDYVATAVRLAKEPKWREALGRRIRARKQVLYHDVGAIVALEDFLIKAVSATPAELERDHTKAHSPYTSAHARDLFAK